jgi:hypothetical protein
MYKFKRSYLWISVCGYAIMVFLFWTILGGCATSPLEGEKIVIIPEIEMHLMGANAYNPWLKGREGLWWSNGTDHRIYIKGWRWREKILPEDMCVLGHEMWHVLEAEYPEEFGDTHY